jgi:hypothetical protein
MQKSYPDPPITESLSPDKVLSPIPAHFSIVQINLNQNQIHV